MIKHGRKGQKKPVKREKPLILGFRVTSHQRDILNEAAKANNMTLQAFVEDALFSRFADTWVKEEASEQSETALVRVPKTIRAEMNMWLYLLEHRQQMPSVMECITSLHKAIYKEVRSQVDEETENGSAQNGNSKSA